MFWSDSRPEQTNQGSKEASGSGTDCKQHRIPVCSALGLGPLPGAGGWGPCRQGAQPPAPGRGPQAPSGTSSTQLPRGTQYWGAAPSPAMCSPPWPGGTGMWHTGTRGFCSSSHRLFLSQEELILVQTQTFDGAAGSGVGWGPQRGSGRLSPLGRPWHRGWCCSCWHGCRGACSTWGAFPHLWSRDTPPPANACRMFRNARAAWKHGDRDRGWMRLQEGSTGSSSHGQQDSILGGPAAPRSPAWPLCPSRGRIRLVGPL